MTPRRWGRRAVLWAGFYGGLSALFCAPLFNIPHATGILDWDRHLFYHGAVLKNVVEYAAFPFWNPWYCGGNVLWQNPQIALLSPAYPLALITSLPLAMKVNIVLHYWIGFIGMHLLLTRAIRLTFPPLVVYLGALFTLSGAPALHLAVGHSVFLPAFYLPFQLLFFLRALQSERVRDALLGGVALALMVYNGGLHIVPMSMAAVGVCSVVAAIARRSWRPVLFALVLGIAGSAYAAPKLLPVTRFMASSRFLDTRIPTVRPDGMTVEMLFHVYVDEYQNRSLKFESQRHGWYEYGNYIGSVAAILIGSSILWILLFRRTPEWWVGVSLAVTSLALLALSAGEFSWWAPASLANHLPLFSAVRIPSRYTIVFVLFAAATVGWAAHAIATKWEFRSRAKALAAIVCIFASLQLVVRNRAHFEYVFSGAPLRARFHLLRGSDTPITDRNPNPYAANAPMYSALMSGRSFYNCDESLQLVHTADPDSPLVGSDGRSKIDRIIFSPNRIEFTALGGSDPSRIVLNQNYAEGWRSSLGPVTQDPQSGKPSVALAAGQAGKFSFAFVPLGVIPGLALFVVSIVASVVSWRACLAPAARAAAGPTGLLARSRRRFAPVRQIVPLDRKSAVLTGPRPIGIAIVVFLATLTVRVWGVSTHFFMLGDQIRDWSIVLGSVRELPLVGPATHVHGYTIGPAFYWIMWVIRATVGPWFQNLPHAGGIGQALLQSGADTLLLVAVWYRTRSIWIALTAIALIATGPLDLSFSATIWNPVIGSILAKTATALVLLDWPQLSPARVAITAAVAWCAVHAYTGTIFVVLSIFAALCVEPFSRGDRESAWRNARLILAVVAVLQLPYVFHQLSNRFGDSAMGAVTGSVGRIIVGNDRLQLGRSAAGYAAAFTFIQGRPVESSTGPMFAWLLAACAVVVAIRYRRDPVVLIAILLPQAAAILGYAFWLGNLDFYYYLSLMPAAVLTIVLGVTAGLPPAGARVAAVALLAGALTIMPARLRFAATMNRMPQYGVLVSASRAIVRQGRVIRAIETDFALPATTDSEFVYRILGGRLDRASPSVAFIAPSGDVVYRNLPAH